MKILKHSFRRNYFYLSTLLLFISTAPILSQTKQSTLEFYFSRAQDATLEVEERKRVLHMAYVQVHKLKKDSVKYWRYSKIMIVADKLNDTILFQKVSREALELADKLGEPNKKGDVHWNYGAYYLKQKKYDSSYFHYDRAYKIYTTIHNNYYSGKMLCNMAYASSMVHDYTGAEIHLFQAIRYFELEKKPKQLYLSYNLLGTISDNLGEFEKSINYYNKAFQFIPLIDSSHFEKIEFYNNMGLIYHKMQDYEQAINYFDKGLVEVETKNYRPSLYAKLLDNRAFSLFMMGGESDIIGPMAMALNLRDSIGDTSGSVINMIHLSKYYAKEGDTTNAIKNAKKAFDMASENKLNRDILQSLTLLSTIDVENSIDYLQEHIALNEQLNRKERGLRNKFTAIQYDTNKYISENQRLFRERSWIIAAAITLTILLLLIYWNTRQRSKNKTLLFEREQQQYNEDMFLLALKNKTTLERGRNLERLRISEELHDGILARLFSVRFKWSFIELSGTNINVEQHKTSINQLVDIETDIRNLAHDLRNDLIWSELEFIDEIENTIRERSDYEGFRYTFKYNDGLQWENLTYLSKTNISRMLDEILQNIIKHSKATEVSIEFTVDRGLFAISVRDNGKGFRVNSLHKGIGLKNLKNRVKKLNGDMTISSKIGYGTSIRIIIPQKP